MDIPGEWKTRKLHKRSTISLAVLDIAIIAAVIAVDRVSSARNGLANIHSDTTLTRSTIARFNWSYGLLWTFIPTLLMTLYRIAWDAVVNATADRQPFVELARDEESATNASRTIMLNYRSYPSFYNWAVAFHHKHHLLAAAMLLSVVLSVILVPLTSHLFTPALTVEHSHLNATASITFDDQALDIKSDLQAAMNVAAAVSIFGASPPEWSTAQYAFEPFSLNNSAKSGNVSANTLAYSALLDCEVKTGSDFSITYNGEYVFIQGTDRGCTLPQRTIITSNASMYTLAWSTQECSAEAHFSRFGIVTAGPSSSNPNQLANVTLLSCIPSYWQTYGQLTVTLAPGKPIDFADFSANFTNSTELRPSFSVLLETALPKYTAFDPTNAFETDGWGHLVYQLANQLRPSSPLDSDNVKTSMETLYPSFFTSVATTYLFKPAGSEQQVEALFSEQVTRLFVVTPIAWTIAIIMGLAFVCNIFLIHHSETSHSILQEEPKGLLSSAALLQNSDVFDVVTHIRETSPEAFDVRERVKTRYSPDTSRVWYDRETKRIRVSGMVPGQEEMTKSDSVQS